MYKQGHIFYLLRTITRNNKWKVFLPLMIHINVTMTAIPDEIVPIFVESEAAIIRENRNAPEAQLFANMCGKGGNGGNAGNVGKGSKLRSRQNRDNMEDNNEKDKDLWRCIHR